jgi:hypothetical protein
MINNVPKMITGTPYISAKTTSRADFDKSESAREERDTKNSWLGLTAISDFCRQVANGENFIFL